MGGLCCNHTGKWFVWRVPFDIVTQNRLVSFDNKHEDITINDLELVSLLSQLHLPPLQMPPITHICTYVNNAAAQERENRGSVSSVFTVVPMLQYLNPVERQHCLHYYLR